MLEAVKQVVYVQNLTDGIPGARTCLAECALKD
jgi:hypothetical protein